MLTTLYIARAALIGTLATLDDPALAPLAAKFFLLLDCVTIPALVNLRGKLAARIERELPRHRASPRHGDRRGALDHTLLFQRRIRRAVRTKRGGEPDLRGVASHPLAREENAASRRPDSPPLSPSGPLFQLAPRRSHPNTQRRRNTMSEHHLAAALPQTMFINGEKTRSAAGKTFPVYNPATVGRTRANSRRVGVGRRSRSENLEGRFRIRRVAQNAAGRARASAAQTGRPRRAAQRRTRRRWKR